MPSSVSPPIRQNPLLGVHRLTLIRQGKCLLDEVSFNLSGNGLSMIMGANGAGKSVLLRTLNGLLEADSGDICWSGKPATDALRKQHAMVFQKPVLLRRSVAANVDYVLKQRGLPQSDERRDRVLEEVGLLEKAAQPARLLSGGEQQRLTLARALVLEPHVLFLDEPTASLDPASIAVFEQTVLKALRRGTKIIFVTHDLGQARRLADDVVFLDKGQVAEHSVAPTFFEQPQSEAAKAYLDGRLFLADSCAT